MYESRFGLNRKPFQSVLTSDDFFESKLYAETSVAVLHALRSELGVAVLTGPAGVGKTVTLESFRRALHEDGQAIVLRGGTVPTASALLHVLHRRLISPPSSERSTDPRGSANLISVERWEVLERIQRIADFWGPVILLLDDAHLIGEDVFSELRSLLEEEADGRKLIRLLVSGPLSLEEVLASPTLHDFAQRIRTHVFLEPLRSTEAVQYLAHQINRVGGDASQIFDPQSLERIVAAADGLPRCLDLLADESLMECHHADKSCVNVDHVNGALARLQHLPYTWNVSLISEDTANEVEQIDCQPIVETVEVRPNETATSVNCVSGGVIEIGGPVDESERVESPALPSNVIEIGAGTDSPALNSVNSEIVSEASDESDEFEATEVTRNEFFAENEDVGESEAAGAIEIGPAAAIDKSESAAPTDFDEIFDSVSVESGSLTVSEVPVRSGFVESIETEQNESKTSSALTGEVVSPNDDLPDQTGPKPTKRQNRGTVKEPVATLSGYTAWSPPGDWISAPKSPRTYFRVPSSANSSPVFDRYTWCELGRSVSMDQCRRHVVLEQLAVPAQWPPTLQGVAPAHRIAVQAFDEEYTDLLSDLGTLITDASESAREVSRSQRSWTRGESDQQVEKTRTIDPEQSIQEIETLLEYQNEEEHVGVVSEDLKTGDETAVTDRLVDEETTTTESSEVRIEQTERNEESDSLEVVTESDEATTSVESTDPTNRPPGSSRQFFTLPIDIDDVQFPGPTPTDENQAPLSEQNRGNLQSDTESQHKTETVTRIQKSEIDTEAENEQEVYVPRLLNEARTRVVSISTSVTSLKRAAGAERLTDVPEVGTENSQESLTHLHVPESDNEESPADSSSFQQTQGFRNLFTRLRKMRKRHL